MPEYCDFYYIADESILDRCRLLKGHDDNHYFEFDDLFEHGVKCEAKYD